MAAQQEVDILKNFRKLAGQCNVAGFQWPDDELIITSVYSHQLCTVYNITSPEGTVCTVKVHNANKIPEVVEAYFLRESVVTNILNDVAEGLCPKSFNYDSSSKMVIQEGVSGYELLSPRILEQGKVDHGITCSVARSLARVHKATHRLSTGETKFTEYTSLFGPSASCRCPDSQTFTQVFDANNLSPAIGQETRHAAEALIRQQAFMTNIDAVRQMFSDNKDCVIHGHLDMSSVLVNQSQDVKFVNWGHAQMGPGVYDVGVLVAHYITAHYVHMLTEENNASHRQVAYAMQDAITKTVEAYLEEQTAYVGNAEQHRVELVSSLAAFTGLELVRKALDTSEYLNGHMTDHVCASILGSGQRLLSRYQTIDTTGRLLMIALQLC